MVDVEYVNGKIDAIILTKREVEEISQGKMIVTNGISIYRR